MNVRDLKSPQENDDHAPDPGDLDPRLSPNQTLGDIDQELQKTLLISTELIAVLPRFNDGSERGAWILADITTMVHWMNFLVGQHEFIVNQMAGQKPSSVILEGRPVCGQCRRDARDEITRHNNEALSHFRSGNPNWSFCSPSRGKSA